MSVAVERSERIRKMHGFDDECRRIYKKSMLKNRSTEKVDAIRQKK